MAQRYRLSSIFQNSLASLVVAYPLFSFWLNSLLRYWFCVFHFFFILDFSRMIKHPNRFAYPQTLRYKKYLVLISTFILCVAERVQGKYVFMTALIG